jgi:hypothetical protein
MEYESFIYKMILLKRLKSARWVFTRIILWVHIIGDSASAIGTVVINLMARTKLNVALNNDQYKKYWGTPNEKQDQNATVVFDSVSSGVSLMEAIIASEYKWSSLSSNESKKAGVNLKPLGFCFSFCNCVFVRFFTSKLLCCISSIKLEGGLLISFEMFERLFYG